MPEFNKWGVSYAIISFFEGALAGHDKVQGVTRDQDIVFTIWLRNGTTLKALLLNEYSLGLAAVLKAKAEFPDVDYIVTGGNWNGYTPEAKEYGRKNGIGIFNTGEFFGALNWTEPKKYHKKDLEGNPTYAYKNS
jgi:hypothetical protein